MKPSSPLPWLVLLLLVFAGRLPAQNTPTAPPVRLALVSATGDAAAAVDLLTAEFSGRTNLQLLERDQVDKVWREQSLAAGNRDPLQLGRVLGADGLLLLESAQGGPNHWLDVRLVAVKPGVILTAERFTWPAADWAGWSVAFTRHLDALLPKLAVAQKDAIPLSVVNLRSAIASASAGATERELKTLAIQRLSQEQPIFVLERQRMELLTDEKELQLDDSAFWNGSWLLEGVIDQNGYSPDTVTIDARLTPSQGGTPLLLTVAGPRTNLAEVINRLALKVDGTLQLHPTATEWNAADEARQYFEEAKWAQAWGVLPEAVAAADSAWMLGQRDLSCATLRLQVHLAEVSARTGGFQNGGRRTFSPGYNAGNQPNGPAPDDITIQAYLREIRQKCPYGVTVRLKEINRAKSVEYVFASQPPDPREIDSALQALELFDDFSRHSAAAPPLLDAHGKNSGWYELGIEDLTVAAQVLRHFQQLPEAQKPVVDKLAELRARARAVAGWMAGVSAIHDGYYVSGKLVPYDTLYCLMDKPNVFSCEAAWGCFWQETPEDGVAMYRELMDSPVFSYIHANLWLREMLAPRLVAWDDPGRQRLPAAWDGFVRELAGSTNVLWQLEARSMALADADTEEKIGLAFTNLFDAIFTNRDALIANPVEQLYLGWGTGGLVQNLEVGLTSDRLEALVRIYWSDYSRRLDALDQDYRNRTVPAMHLSAVFEQQKEYLRTGHPFDFMQFVKLFPLDVGSHYSPEQAQEILPLIAMYRSNLVTRANRASPIEKGQLEGAVYQVGYLQDQITKSRQPPASPARVATMPARPPAAPVRPVAPAAAREVLTNILTVSRFLPVSRDGLPGDYISDFIITAHQWLENRLLLDLQYTAEFNTFDAQGNFQSSRHATYTGVALVDPAGGRPQVIPCAELDFMTESRFYRRSTLFHGELYHCDGGRFQKYDSAARKWQTLPVSTGGNWELFVVNGRLYESDGSVVAEVLDGGQSTRILASTRRRPPVSALDMEDLAIPVLFEGADHSLRIIARDKLFSWTGTDWQKLATVPASFMVPPQVFADGILFHQIEGGITHPDELFRLGLDTTTVELCFWQQPASRLPQNRQPPQFGQSFHHGISFSPGPAAPIHPQPLWELSTDWSIASLAAGLDRSNLYFLAGHSTVRNIVNDQHVIVRQKVESIDGYNATLLCFSRSRPEPRKIGLNFAVPGGGLPVTGNTPGERPMFPGTPSAWMLFTTNDVIMGPEAGGFPRHGLGGNRPDYQTGVWLLPAAELANRFATP